MKILVLGASGLLGHNVLDVLLKQGHEVVALVRNPGVMRIDQPHCSIRKGVLDLRTILEASDGCEAIINCAGTTNMALLHLEDYYPMNRDLCETLVEVMRRNRSLRSLVHVSTANTIGYGSPQHLATESDPMQSPFAESFYALSKLEGEQVLTKAAHEFPDRHIIMINPGFMVGAYDVKPSSGALLLAANRKPLMAAPKGGKSFVHVRDVAMAAVSAIENGRSGTRYLATGTNMPLKDFYRLQAQICGYRQWLLSLPNSLVLAAGLLGDLLRRLGLPTQLSTRNVRQLMIMEFYDCRLAQKELNMPQTPIEEAIKDFFADNHRK